MEFKGFLIALFIACVTSQKCPPIEDLPLGIVCMEKNDGSFDVYCLGGDTTMEDYMEKLQEVNFPAKTKIDLKVLHFNKESKLPSRIFNGLNIRSLEFHNNFSRWADEEGGPAFLGLEDSLEKVSFMSDTLTKTEKSNINDHQHDKAPMSLGHLRKLREVDITANSIYSFANGWFGQGSNSLEVLKLYLCRIFFIGNQAFAGLTKLRKIEITMNRVSSVARSMFPNPANYLKEINLYRNLLEAVPDDMFTNMPSLTRVDLSSNSLYRLPETVWRPIWSRLEVLNLKYNALDCDDHIEWMFKVRPPKHIDAKCMNPEEKRDVELRDLIRENQ